MPPTLDATLTEIGSGLYAVSAGSSEEASRHTVLRPDQRASLDLLAKNKATIDRDVLVPILESADIYTTFADKRSEYKDWRHAWVTAIADETPANDANIKAAMEKQDDQDDNLKSIFTRSRDNLSDSAVSALLGALSLKKIVRNSTMPHAEEWPEESWQRLTHLFASSELCMIGVLHHLATGIGRNENVQTLADWSFLYAEDAYNEAGYFGKVATTHEGTK